MVDGHNPTGVSGRNDASVSHVQGEQVTKNGFKGGNSRIPMMNIDDGSIHYYFSISVW